MNAAEAAERICEEMGKAVTITATPKGPVLEIQATCKGRRYPICRAKATDAEQIAELVNSTGAASCSRQTWNAGEPGEFSFWIFTARSD